ncbi:unnamed protein product [Aspergillus oryzae]|nr:unnamed protein product [Aspergillus oryzae]
MPSKVNIDTSLKDEKNDMHNGDGPNITVVAKEAPITVKRIPATHINEAIDNPGVARADVAVSIEKPSGDQEWANKVRGYVCSNNGNHNIQRLIYNELTSLMDRPLSSSTSYSGTVTVMG